MSDTENTEFRHLLKAHSDIFTVSEFIKEIYQEYGDLGYRLGIILPSSFSYYLDDDTEIMVYWGKGFVYENNEDTAKYFDRSNDNDVKYDLDFEE